MAPPDGQLEPVESRVPESARVRRPTSTSSFGTSRREAHDASAFYDRFSEPDISDDDTVATPRALDTIVVGDSRSMDEVAPSSVALVVTSPPYFAGKEYEEAMGEGHVPASYLEYLDMLTAVFSECVDKLEPGGRIAVNVANLGRRPYRSLAADVIDILQNRLHLLLRGEIVWTKAKGAAGSCAWGSFQSAANPVLRDLTERVIVASKGRFDRAKNRRERSAAGLPSEDSIWKDEFMEATTDVWEIAAESATRVGHPAPFPVELPQRCIELYTYRGDLVLDPFMGSGSTAVAAVRTDRHYVGYDTDGEYVAAARERVRNEVASRAHEASELERERVELPAVPTPLDADEDAIARMVREGRAAKEVAEELLRVAGFDDVVVTRRQVAGTTADLKARDATGRTWHFDLSGSFTTGYGGLRRSDVLWNALGRAAVMGLADGATEPLVLLTTDLPTPASAGGAALRKARGELIVDAVELLSPAGRTRLAAYATGTSDGRPVGELLDPSRPTGAS